MKPDKGLRFLVLLTIGIAIFFGAMQMYGRSTNGRENIVKSWNETTQTAIKVPTTVATLRRNQLDRLFQDWDPLDPLVDQSEGDEPYENEEEDVPEIDGEGAERIISAAKSVWQQWVNKGGYYTQTVTTWSDGSTHRMDCSSYVSTVLKEAGYDIGMQQSSTLPAALASGGFTLVGTAGSVAEAKSMAQAGDIMVYQGHTQIAAGNGMTYNWGGCGTVPSKTFPSGGYCAKHGKVHPKITPPTEIRKNKACKIYRLAK